MNGCARLNIFINYILFTYEKFQKIEFTAVRQSDNEPVKIIICLVGNMSADDPYYTVVFNIIMRKCLEYLKLQLVGREYYDATNKVRNLYFFILLNRKFNNSYNNDYIM